MLGNAGQGINKKLPHMGDAGRGIDKQLPHVRAGQGRSQFILDWFTKLQNRLREVRVACGDWRRVLTESVTTRHGMTAIFLDPPYTKGSMDYAIKSTGGAVSNNVREWCVANGGNKIMRIVLCGHAGEHDGLLELGWHTRSWISGAGYATTDAAKENRLSETLWCSPHCMPERAIQEAFQFEEA